MDIIYEAIPAEETVLGRCQQCGTPDEGCDTNPDD